ncbi:hypothetical protein E4U55_003736 [Claviceps digitariae]|nr:hypothetical protein E4U55_003736 [Claviceps digitariae]
MILSADNNNNCFPPSQVKTPQQPGGHYYGGHVKKEGRIIEDQALMAPLNHLRSAPSKDIHTDLADVFNQFLCLPEEKLVIIKRAIEILHSATLLIDDIQDSSKLRRGIPAAYTIYGIPQTINCANMAYFLAEKELNKLSNPRALTIFTEELINLHDGQGMDVVWRDALHCPTEEEYLRMVRNKTGAMFRLIVRLLQNESSNTHDLVPLIETLSLLWQIHNDYENLQSDGYFEKKGYCEDIAEGKFSYPVVHSIHARPGDQRLLDILKLHTEDLAAKQTAVALMESTGSFEYCRKKIDALNRQLNEQLTALEDGATSCGDQFRAVLGLLEVKARPGMVPAM